MEIDLQKLQQNFQPGRITLGHLHLNTIIKYHKLVPKGNLRERKFDLGNLTLKKMSVIFIIMKIYRKNNKPIKQVDKNIPHAKQLHNDNRNDPLNQKASELKGIRENGLNSKNKDLVHHISVSDMSSMFRIRSVSQFSQKKNLELR